MKKINLNKNLNKESLIQITKLVDDYLNSDMSISVFVTLLEKNGLNLSEKFEYITKKLIKLNNKVYDIFTDNDLKIFPYAGTLLGFFRDRNIIDHDDDCDWTTSFYHFEKKLAIIKKELNESGYSIFRAGENIYNNDFYFYKIQSQDKIFVKLGKYEFKLFIEGDIFPILYLNSEAEYKDIFESFALSNNFSRNATHTGHIKTINSKKAKKISFILNDKNFINDWTKFMENLTPRWDEQKHKKFSEEFNEKYKKYSYPKNTKMFTLSPEFYFQNGFFESETIILNTKFGIIKYRNRTDIERSLVYWYGDWEKPPEVKTVHFLFKENASKYEIDLRENQDN